MIYKQTNTVLQHRKVITGKKKQVVETTCESHEKTSKGNLCLNPERLPTRVVVSPEQILRRYTGNL